jgi:hypothetical protein
VFVIRGTFSRLEEKNLFAAGRKEPFRGWKKRTFSRLEEKNLFAAGRKEPFRGWKKRTFSRLEAAPTKRLLQRITSPPGFSILLYGI